MSCGIYKITNNINQKVYIGQSIDIIRRWRNHKSFNESLCGHYPLYQAFKKYGLENFSFEIIEECLPQELNDKEIYWIDFYNSYYNGYNQTTGGQESNNATIKISKEDIQIIYDLLLNSSISQKEIASMFLVGEDTISEINQGKTRINPNLNYPLRKRVEYFCMDCGVKIYSGALRCDACNRKSWRITERPSREELKNLIRTTSFTQIGKQYGVTDNTIRKWCDAENLPRKVKDIKTYSDEEWAKI